MVSRYSRTLPAFALLAMMTVSTGPANAQVTDPRLVQMEEQMRSLTGRVEELNFQILQLQEQIRRMQEDNEFRLQQLEEGQQGSLPPASTPQTGEPETDLAAQTPQLAAPKAPRLDPVAAEIAAAEKPTVYGTLPSSGNGTTGAPPRSLGTMTIDPAGQVIDTTVDFSPRGVAGAIDGTQVASVTIGGNAEDIYTTGYNHVLQGDYGLAQAVFESFISIYPDDPLVPDARFWLGESLLQQGRFEEAAEVFVDTQSMYPSAPKAPETMLKIGTIMAALGNRDVACVTLADAIDNYPSMAETTRATVKAEQAKAQC